MGAFFFGIFWNVRETISEEIGWLLTTSYVKIGITLFLLFFSLAINQAVGLKNSPRRIKAIVPLMGIIEVIAVALVNYGLTIDDAIFKTDCVCPLERHHHPGCHFLERLSFETSRDWHHLSSHRYHRNCMLGTMSLAKCAVDWQGPVATRDMPACQIRGKAILPSSPLDAYISASPPHTRNGLTAFRAPA